MKKYALDLCTLIRSILKNEKTDLSGMDLPAVHKMAKMQSLSAIAYMAAAYSGGDLDPQWKQEKDKAVRKNLLFSVARQEVCAKLDAAGIWHMPLKGSILAELYPKLGMRQMADCDILFDKKHRTAVRDIMEGLGYVSEHYGKGNHDVYKKEPVYNFEMHVDLFGELTGNNFMAYYEKVEERLLPGGGMLRKFSPEDFYVYFLAHGYKHFYHSGNGLRFLVDCYVFLAAQADLDQVYLEQELQKLELTDFERMVRTLSWKLFGTGEPLTEEEEQTLLYCAKSGTYGNEEHRVENDLRRIQPEGELTTATRLKYIWRRIWPNQTWFAANYPFLAKYWILKPFFVLWRIFRVIFTNGRHLLREIKATIKQ